MNHLDPSTRHEFVLLFDVTNGNPNGDPDAGNLPRVDPETMHGLVTDVAIKRKVRDYLHVIRETRIFIQSEAALNALIGKSAEEVGAEKNNKVANADIREVMCRDYYDIRLFGAVLSTGDYNAGQVRGPVQLTFARSLDPVLPMDMRITRQARTTEERMETGQTEMGRKPIIPYGLYRGHGFFNPYLAEQTGVSQDDLEAFWEALTNLFEFDRSAARGEMVVRGLWVFTHENKKGNAPAHKLFELVDAHRDQEVESPRSFGDYAVSVDESAIPDGVQLTSLVAP